MLNEKQIQAIFLSSKWVVKQWCIGPVTANKDTVQWWFKMFCKGDESLEDEEHNAWPSEVDNDQLRAIIKADPLNDHMRSCRRTQGCPFYSCLAFEENWKGDKARWVGTSLADCKSKKLSLWSVVFCYPMQQQWTIFQSDCDVHWKVDFIWQPATTGWSEKTLQSTSQSQTCTKKKSHGHFGGLLLVWSTTTCWIPAKTLHLRSMLSKSMSCTKNCSDLAAGIGQQNGPNSPRQCPAAPCTTSASEAEWVGLWSFASSAIFTWPLANWLPLLQASQQLFAEKMLPQPAGCRKGFPRVRQILKHRFSCYRNKHFSLAKMCWL